MIQIYIFRPNHDQFGYFITLIYKIHGDFDNPKMFVITDDDVLDEENTRPGIIGSLKDAFIQKDFLFIGCLVPEPFLIT